MFRTLMIAALIAVPAAASAQDRAVNTTQAESGKAPDRIRNVTLVGQEKCPTAEGNEVVVCSRLDANEQFRVPKELRESKPDAANQAWANRAATIDEVGRVAAGLPNTCSPVGSGGQTGCTTKMMQDYTADKVDRKRRNSTVP